MKEEQKKKAWDGNEEKISMNKGNELKQWEKKISKAVIKCCWKKEDIKLEMKHKEQGRTGSEIQKWEKEISTAHSKEVEER